MLLLSMGRIKTTLIKRKSNEILRAHPERFTKDFKHNKVSLGEVAEVESKKMRNTIAGYICRLVKQNEQRQ